MSDAPIQKKISEKTIERLCFYRRLLEIMKTEGTPFVYSHTLAALSGGTAAQVRRDLMILGYNGNPRRGYKVEELIAHIDDFYEAGRVQNVAIVGVGNLGRAIMSYFCTWQNHFSVVAAFDVNPDRLGPACGNTPCYPIERLKDVVREKDIQVAIVTVPALAAQGVVDQLVETGIKGILNFAPVRLKTPKDVFVENMDMTMVLEKVVFFARHSS